MSSLSAPRGRRRLAHDDTIPLEPEITPTKTRQPVDKILDGLNTKWDLELPRLHGRVAEEGESTPSPARRCSARIRYLFYKDVDLGQLLCEFDEKASLIRSGWVFKPRAEGSVTPLRAPNDSTLSRRIIKGKLPQLDDAQRRDLLVCLEKTLEEPYDLARLSDSFKATTTSRHVHSHRLSTPSASSKSTMKSHSKVIKAASQESPSAKRTQKGSRTSTKRQSEPATDAETQPKKTKLTDFYKRLGTSRLDTTNDDQYLATANADLMNEDAGSMSGSNSTLALSDLADTSFPPTQEADDLFTEELIKESHRTATTGDSGYESSSPVTLLSRFSRAIDATALNLPIASLTFDFAYELQSLALAWSERAIDIRNSVVNICRAEAPSAERRLAAYKALAKGRFFEPFRASSWDPAAGLPPEKELCRSTYLEAALSWRETRDPEGGVFNLRLRAPRTQQSCRFYRTFGGHRFLTLNVPDQKTGPLKDFPDQDYRRAIAEWLCEGIYLAQRHWRPFWLEDKPRQDKDGNWMYQVHLFATAGVGVDEPLSLRQFLDRHTPLTANKESDDNKLFARMKLGLSKTTPTVVLLQSQFREVDDIRSSEGKVMTDGCALMSPDLGVTIARMMHLDEVPSAFQGRIGGAKGMWLVDKRSSFSHGISGTDYWIEIRPSQLKILPHPVRRVCGDETSKFQASGGGGDEARTFEVSDWSKSLRPSALNSQFVSVLYNGGVGRDVLGDRLKSVTAGYYQELCESLQKNDPLLTRAWLQKYHGGKSQHADFHFVGGRPITRIDQIKTYLDVGFSPREHQPLHELIYEVLKGFLNDFVEKPRIELPRSTFAFMVPDVWGILQEGEVQLCLGQPWIDPETGMESTFIADMDGLVARNPANHPSDFQRVKLVHYAELAGYSNLVFFSTRGPRPLADYLSGGDYDGDQAFVCWDSEIVQRFQNYRGGPPDHIQPKDVFLVKSSLPLTEIFSEGPNNGINDNTVLKYVQKCLEFSLRQSYVGMVTNTHVAYVYHKSRDRPSGSGSRVLELPGAITLAALAAFLVDASKQGYDLPVESWHALRRNICGPKLLDKPTYQKPEDSVPEGFESSNILDYLRFKIARAEKKRIMKDWNGLAEKFPRKPDDSLLEAYRFLDGAADAERAAGSGRVCRQILTHLKSDLDKVFESWKVIAAPKEGKDLAASRRAIDETYKEYKAIEPMQPDGEERHWLCMMLAADKKMKTNVWQSIRASCLYRTRKNSSRFVWSMAGLELCEMKARSMGNIIPVQARTYGTMKINAKMAKIVSETVTEEEQDLDLLDEDEMQYFDAQTSLADGPQPMTIRDYF